jgi:hypothetical protein
MTYSPRRSPANLRRAILLLQHAADNDAYKINDDNDDDDDDAALPSVSDPRQWQSLIRCFLRRGRRLGGGVVPAARPPAGSVEERRRVAAATGGRRVLPQEHGQEAKVKQGAGEKSWKPSERACERACVRKEQVAKARPTQAGVGSVVVRAGLVGLFTRWGAGGEEVPVPSVLRLCGAPRSKN